jgi:hypothetical protein
VVGVIEGLFDALVLCEIDTLVRHNKAFSPLDEYSNE